MKTGVLLIDSVLAHYRKDFFEALYNSDDFEFEIIAGNSFLGIQSLQGNENKLFSYSSFKFVGHTFYYLNGVVKYVLSKKAPVIICTGVDFHLIHTIIIYLIHRILLRKKFYWWSHANLGNQGRFGFVIRKFFYKNSSGIFTYSNEGRENLLFMGIAENKIKIVGNSINIDDYGYLNHDIVQRKSNEIFTVLYSGRITKAKKIYKLINALQILKVKWDLDFKCYLIGDGELNNIVELANELGISDKIDFVGAKYGKDAHSYFLGADIFVYPGGIGLSILHALSFGIPVITTNDTSQHFPEFELLKEGYNGDLYMDNSIENLAEKIIEWKEKLIVSKGLYSKNCIQSIIDMGYLPDAMSNKFFELLKRT